MIFGQSLRARQWFCLGIQGARSPEIENRKSLSDVTKIRQFFSTEPDARFPTTFAIPPASFQPHVDRMQWPANDERIQLSDWGYSKHFARYASRRRYQLKPPRLVANIERKTKPEGSGTAAGRTSTENTMPSFGTPKSVLMLKSAELRKVCSAMESDNGRFIPSPVKV